MASIKADITMLQEVGVNWSLVNCRNRLSQRLNKFFTPGETCCYTGHNTKDQNKDHKQWGGTSIITKGKLKHHTMAVSYTHLTLPTTPYV